MNRYITESDRYQIEILLKQKYGISEISGILGIEYHTLWHEIKKGTVMQLDTNLMEHYVYKADYAQMLTEKNMSNRGRNLKIGSDYGLVSYIEDMVKNKKYSPEALLLHADNSGMQFKTRLCFKTIYNYFDMGLFLNASCDDLPQKKKTNRKKQRKPKVALNNRSGRSIDERGKEVIERNMYGHWEMDTVVGGQGKGSSCLLVLSERKAREEIIIKLDNKKTVSVCSALDSLERKLGSRKFREKFKTITCDNGVEFLDSEGIESSCLTKTKRTVLYYCHPYSSWERGTNENINRLIRRFFPKGINFDEVSEKQVRMVEDWINNYPRKILGGISSREYISRLLPV